MLDLDALVASAKQAAAAKQAPKRQTPTLHPDEPHRIVPEWKPAGLCFRREGWNCVCGAHGYRPLGLFILQTHTRMTASRFVAIRHESELPDMPRFLHTEDIDVSICPSCAPEHGFSTIWVAPRPPAVVSNLEGRGAGFKEEWDALRAAPETNEGEDDETSEA